ncbi:MAG: T9SS type A sorting domain-containing protein [Cytophagales bacterium]
MEQSFGTKLEFHPNPAIDLFKIQIVNDFEATCVSCSFFDVSGKRCLPNLIENSGKEMVFNRNGLPSGVYVVEMLLSNGKQIYGKLILVD